MELQLTVLVCLFCVVYAGMDSYNVETRVAKPGEVGYHVAIEEIVPDPKKPRHACSGAAIDKLWALTTSFCVLPMKTAPARIKDFQVVAGKLKLSTPAASELVRKIATVFTHEKYPVANTSLLSVYDIGLIKLAQAFDLDKGVVLIPLPSKDESIGKKGELSGWNSIRSRSANKPLEDLTIQSLDTLDPETCASSIPTPQIVEASEAKDSLICTGPKFVNDPICIGDTGSPFVKPKRFFGSIKLIGILSYTVQSFDKIAEGPAVYTKVPMFVSWINDIMKKN